MKDIIYSSSNRINIPTDYFHKEDVKEMRRGERIRTSGPLVPNQVRYQAAPRPDVRLS